MAHGDWGHKLSPIAPGATCSLCGHVGTQADPVLATDEQEVVRDIEGRPRTEHWTAYRCQNAFACQERRAKAGQP